MPEQPTTVPLPLGRMGATDAARKALAEAGENAEDYFLRHNAGDHGDATEEQKQRNKDAPANGDRIISIYHLSTGVPVCVATETDRSVTLLFLPPE